MFDEWIEIGRVAEAYGLDAVECIELAQRVPCKFGPSSHHKPYDLEKIDYRAQAYARKLMESTDQSAVFSVFALVLGQWWKKGKQGDGSLFDTYKLLLDQGEKEDAFKSLWPFMRLFFVLDLKVDKVQAILAFDRAGFPFKTEVKGLSRALVDSILEANRAALPSPSNTVASDDASIALRAVHSGSHESSQCEPRTNREVESASPAGQEIAYAKPLPLSKPEVTQKEAAALAVVSIRTISAWDNGEGTPEGYPGRRSRANFMVFCHDHKQSKLFGKSKRAINRAAPSGDMDDFGNLEGE